MRLACLALVVCSPLLAQLPPKEAADGWIQLFDGESLFGWSQEGAGQWKVEGGALTFDAGQVGWLRSNSVFADYVLKLDFRARKGGNSGLFVRSAKTGLPHETGYEVQIWDDNPKFPTGSLVNHVRAKKAKIKADQWNAYEIRIEGDRFQVTLNGKKILDARDAKSKAGHIGLQANKDRIEFRNIKLKPLGMKALFDGKTLAGWKVIQPPKPPKEPAEWSVKDGAIHVVKGGGQLETEATYANFVLQLDVRTNPRDANHHPNSGVFLRGEPNTYWNGYEVQIRNEYKDGDRTKPVDWGTGAMYNRVATRKVVSDDGVFYAKTIAANGKHFAVWLNGYPVTDWDDPRPEGNNARQNARLGAGAISLQAHDPTTNLDFRNVRLGVLP
ncbi:MAG: DUF1080 domain-containing protein [Bryobacterales bacterium]|nr:DUF1080 domain-containing protein [Bryobacterales bacterium]